MFLTGEDGLLFPSDRDPAVHLSETTLNGRTAVLTNDGAVVRAGFGGAKRNAVPGAAISVPTGPLLGVTLPHGRSVLR